MPPIFKTGDFKLIIKKYVIVDTIYSSLSAGKF